MQGAIAKGIMIATEDRRRQGIVACRSIRENIALPNLKQFANGLFVNRKKEEKAVDMIWKRLRIKAPSQQTLVQNLSGGNQQKVSIGKMVASGSRILIFDEPTKGIDVSAKAKVYSIIRELAAEGCAILVISSYNPELLGICDRIAVMSRGKIVQTYDRGVTEETLMLAQQQG